MINSMQAHASARSLEQASSSLYEPRRESVVISTQYKHFFRRRLFFVAEHFLSQPFPAIVGLPDIVRGEAGVTCQRHVPTEVGVVAEMFIACLSPCGGWWPSVRKVA